jgi:hypothetical protein
VGTCVLERSDSKLLSLRWDQDPRNVMIVKKPGVGEIGDALVEFAKCDSFSPPLLAGQG